MIMFNKKEMRELVDKLHFQTKGTKANFHKEFFQAFGVFVIKGGTLHFSLAAKDNKTIAHTINFMSDEVGRTLGNIADNFILSFQKFLTGELEIPATCTFKDIKLPSEEMAAYQLYVMCDSLQEIIKQKRIYHDKNSEEKAETFDLRNVL